MYFFLCGCCAFVHIYRLLNISDSDILFDLGCGDGRVVIQAFSEYKCRGVGVEYDSDLCEKAVLKMKDVEDCCEYVTIVHNSVENIDFSEATVLFIYLVPEGIKAIRDKLIRALDRGVRIVTYGKCIVHINGYACDLICPILILYSVFNTWINTSRGNEWMRGLVDQSVFLNCCYGISIYV